MKKITKQKWMNALRSGKFEQGRGFLCWGNKYCCLGVLAKITGNLTKLKGSTGVFGFGKNEKVYSCQLLPLEHPSNNYKFGLLRQEGQKLIQMNDHDNKSFSEIADWVEENIKTED